METRKDKLSCVLATDCGSTTTKALLFEKCADGWRQTWRGEAPTTVEKPVADVTAGARNAFQEIEELSGRRILNGSLGDQPFLELQADGKSGIDLYVSTSSAGGGLQMMVAGVVRKMTAESAERAALGAGAIVLDVVSADDGREEHERIDRMRHLKPDIVLLTGGTDGGTKAHVIEVAETLVAAAPRPRFGDTLKLPVIYAGNKDAAEEVAEILRNIAQVSVVENVRPELERENLGPAREAIHDFFLSHVMSHSPGYDTLMSWTPVPVMPTPAAVGEMVQEFARAQNLQVICADIGGATTDVFSVFRNFEGRPLFNRTVSANLGMSYSIANVLLEAGADAVARWLPYELETGELRNRLLNKMIRPTSIPQTLEDLWMEQAVCREALRLSLEHHRSLAVGLSGVQQQRGIADIFRQRSNRAQLVDMLKLDIVIGSGGVLSHAPNRLSAALMMLDGFGLAGVTEIAVDSIFMLPHLGVFASVHPEAASEIFLRDCLVRICCAVVPIFPGENGKITELAEVRINGDVVGRVRRGQVRLLAELPSGPVELAVRPLADSIDVGAGPGRELLRNMELAAQTLVLDGRNRPIEFAANPQERIRAQAEIFAELGLTQS